MTIGDELRQGGIPFQRLPIDGGSDCPSVLMTDRAMARSRQAATGQVTNDVLGDGIWMR